ncbi:DNA cytosine methyltransferase [Salinicola acroporae]|uniref:DNA cytosine methyltransferase n=1 Tax=Salinicola acroporae TaxID=1541440 RepID=UPI002457F6D7|nr:DNA cytosine methyltransferase [Salinicola acroporae]
MTSLALNLCHEQTADNFAGAGGASEGIEQALGRPVDLAINHDAVAIAAHTANHPGTRHAVADVWDINPDEATGGQPVGLAWFSPDCRHHSKAKGGRPVSKSVRGLAWVSVRWAARVKPRAIILENVEEFLDWGPWSRTPRATWCQTRSARDRCSAALYARSSATVTRSTGASYEHATTARRQFVSGCS